MVESENGQSDADTIDTSKSTSETIEMETFSNHNENEESGPEVNNNIEENHSSSVVKCHNMKERLCKFIIFHIVIMLVVGVMLIPIILYYTNQSSSNFNVSGIVDLKSCSVSYSYKYICIWSYV